MSVAWKGQILFKKRKQRPLYKLGFLVFKVDESDSLQDSFEFDELPKIYLLVKIRL